MFILSPGYFMPSSLMEIIKFYFSYDFTKPSPKDIIIFAEGLYRGLPLKVNQRKDDFDVGVCLIW